MAGSSLEERVSALEEDIARIKEAAERDRNQLPWWEQIAGTFKNDPDYEEAMRLGREYRESLRPPDYDSD